MLVKDGLINLLSWARMLLLLQCRSAVKQGVLSLDQTMAHELAAAIATTSLITNDALY